MCPAGLGTGGHGCGWRATGGERKGEREREAAGRLLDEALDLGERLLRESGGGADGVLALQAEHAEDCIDYAREQAGNGVDDARELALFDVDRAAFGRKRRC